MLQVNPTRINRCDDPRRCLRFLEQEGRLFTLEGMAPLQVAKGVAGMEQEMKHQAADHLFNINWIYVSRNTIHTYNIQFTYRNIFILYIYIYIMYIICKILQMIWHQLRSPGADFSSELWKIVPTVARFDLGEIRSIFRYQTHVELY
jgi:hypothetical protein